MADPVATSKPLMASKPSDSNLAVSLHPLVLLTISDQLTRRRVRNDQGPLVGALLGQQKGRETTIEHAFQCKVITNDIGEALLDQDWFETRLQQYKDVHKLPALEFVGWFTLCPEDGPTSAVLPIQKQLIWAINESALLLAFHPSAVSSTATSDTTGKLPLTIYESSFEGEQGKQSGSMQVDGEDSSGIKFRSLTYSIETDETEMIAIDYVARGAGNASAVRTGGELPSSPEATDKTEKKGKKRADKSDGGTNGAKDATNPLAPEEEDQIAGMTTRLNSVRMLQSRLSLLSAFLRSHPSSYLSDASAPVSQTAPDPGQLPHLRNIQALLTRLSLLTPSAGPTTTPATTTSVPDSLTGASLSQSNDVALSSLLTLLGQDIQGLTELGRKFAMVEQNKTHKGKAKGGFASGNFGMGGDDIGMGSMGVSNMLV